MSERTGRISGINGNMIIVDFDDFVIQNEVAYAVTGEEHLKSEIIRIRGNQAELQVYENTENLKVGDKVEFSGELLAVELGPGLLTQIYDGLQNPLPLVAEECGFFLKRGVYLQALSDIDKWEWTPKIKKGQKYMRLQKRQEFQQLPYLAYLIKNLMLKRKLKRKYWMLQEN